MKPFIVASFTLHAIVLLFMVLGVGNPFQRALKDDRPLIVDFIQVAEKSAAPKLAPQQKIDLPKPIPPEPEAKTEEAQQPPEVEKPQPEKPKPQDNKLEQDKPTKEKPKADSVPPKNPLKKKEDKINKPKEKPKKNQSKAEVNLRKEAKSVQDKNKKVDPKTKKKPKVALDNLLKSVNKDSEESPGEEGAPAETIGDTITASEIDALRHHMRKCWSVPAGIQGAKDMVVDIKMEISKDGTVMKADIVDKARLARDGAFRTAAESAKRAVLDPQCNPLPLPPGKYDQWKNLEFSFNPKDMY